MPKLNECPRAISNSFKASSFCCQREKSNKKDTRTLVRQIVDGELDMPSSIPTSLPRLIEVLHCLPFQGKILICLASFCLRVR